MVSRSGKKASSLFFVLDWISILCSGCFGAVTRCQRSLSVRPSPYLTLRPDVKMGNLTLHRSAQPHALPDIESLAWKLANEGLDDDEVVAFDDDDDAAAAAAESEDSDGMFHGLFYLGSKVLTEVELQSPVEENKIMATPIRTPRRSNNSSCASSTRELDFSSSQVCIVDSESCCSSDAGASVSPCQYSTQSMSPFGIKTSSPCRQELKSAMMCPSLPHEQMDHISTVSSFEGSSAKQDQESTPLYKKKGLDCKTDDDIARFPLYKDSDGILDEENLRPLSKLSRDGEPLIQSCTLWTDRKCQARTSGLFPDCRTVDPSLKPGKTACAFRLRGSGKYAVVSEGLRAETHVGSLPADGSNSNISSRGWRKDDDGRRRVRSLTDEDFNELRGCIDLGFVFTQDHIPDLCETLPALEVCYAIAHGPISPVCNLEDSKSVSPGSPPISPWKVASPGDEPHQVKTRLRHWAQAVACNVRQAH